MLSIFVDLRIGLREYGESMSKEGMSREIVQFRVEFFKPGNEILCNECPFDDDVLFNMDQEDPEDHRLKLFEESPDDIFKKAYKVIKPFESIQAIGYIGDCDWGSVLEIIVSDTTTYEVFQEWVEDIVKIAEEKMKDSNSSLKAGNAFLDILDISEKPIDPKIPLSVNVITLWEYKSYMTQGYYDVYPECEEEWDLLGEVNLNEIKKTLGEKND